jgi:hypothetical protein
MRVIVGENLVDKRSREKHPDEKWQDMKFSYILKKIISHLIKWWWARRGNYNGVDGPHHMDKIRWYAKKVMLIEEAGAKKNDDRPVNRTKMSAKFVVNAVEAKFLELRG